MNDKRRKLPRYTHILLMVAVAAALLIATYRLPVLRIYGSSMEPTLREKEIVLSVKSSNFEQGDLIAFYIGNKLLVKRCIAGPGQLVEINADGNVLVDGAPLDEPYLTGKTAGEGDTPLPCRVPDDCYFCLGDNRAESVDSRHSCVGCIAREQILGKIVFRVWPLNGLGGL